MNVITKMDIVLMLLFYSFHLAFILNFFYCFSRVFFKKHKKKIKKMLPKMKDYIFKNSIYKKIIDRKQKNSYISSKISSIWCEKAEINKIKKKRIF